MNGTNMRKFLFSFAALFLWAAFDGGDCGDEPAPEPLRKDYEFKSDELDVFVDIDMIPRVTIQVSLSRPYTTSTGDTQSERIAISSSRFLLNGTEMVPPYSVTLDPSIEGASLTYIDVDGTSHDIAIPPVPNTFVTLPETISMSEPLEVFWDGAPVAPEEDVLEITIDGDHESVGHYATPGDQSVVFSAGELSSFMPGPADVTVELVRERTLRPYPGTNGGALRIRQLPPDVVATLE